MAPIPKLTPDLRAQIAEAKRANPAITQAEIATQFSIHRTLVREALRGEPTAALLPPASTAVQDIPLNQLTRCPLNHRKTFDEDALQELASSIATTNGPLQNLLVRPSQDGTYEVIAGERRLRAMQILLAAGQMDETHLVPCQVRDISNAEVRVLNLTENLHQQKPPPLELAEGLLALHQESPKTWTVKAMAGRLGMVPRNIHHYLAIATKLSPHAKQLLSKKAITVEAARLLTTLTFDAQDDVLQRLGDDYDNIPIDVLRWEIQHQFIPTSRAIFDVAASGLVTFLDESQEFFESRSEFFTHQTAAAEAMAAEIGQKWAWVKISTPAACLDISNYRADLSSQDIPKGAIITINNDGSVALETHLVERSGPLTTLPQAEREFSTPNTSLQPANEPEEPSAKSPISKSHIYRAHARKTQALRGMVAATPLLATQLATYALLLAKNRVVQIKSGTWSMMLEDRVAPDAELQGRIDQVTTKIKKFLTPDAGHSQELNVWFFVKELRKADLESLFAHLVAREVSTPAGFSAELGDLPVAIDIAKTAALTGHEQDEGLTIQRDDLTGLRKPTLLHLADQFGTPGVNDEVPAKEIADLIAKHSAKHVLPTYRFAPTETILREMGGL
jgi:ParB/RepB/Spo0J family partition protein